MEIDQLPLLVGSVVGGELVLPYHRVYRPCRKATNSGYNSWIYLTDHEYAKLRPKGDCPWRTDAAA